MTSLSILAGRTVAFFILTVSPIPGMVPGGVHIALLKHGVIKDPFYRKNDAEYIWIGRADWTFYTTFTGTLSECQTVFWILIRTDFLSVLIWTQTVFKGYQQTTKVNANICILVSEKFFQKTTILLVCDGLDTVSVVYINDKEVGRSINMFVRYVFDVKHALHVGKNTIKIAFMSAVTYGKQRQAELSYTIPPDCPPKVLRGECNGNKVRKMQCAFSWDWGPAFVTQGIWKDIYLQGFNTAVIRDVTTETTKDTDGMWILKVDVYLETKNDSDVTGTLSFSLGHAELFWLKRVSIPRNTNDATITLKETIPKTMPIDTWWPTGYGTQTLYPLTVIFTSQDQTEISQKTIKIGFRTVELVQDLVSSKEDNGRTFYFRVNGQPVFLKGSNWIPADSFPERATKERIYNYLKSAKDANMNSLRVWGGGIYESDAFFEIADELGILIWQDFMFACAMYPADEAFLRTVSEEITHQIRRIKHHPSLLAYSGNNENEQAMKHGWWPGVRGNKQILNDYIKLYAGTIETIVKQEDPQRPFMMSSPSNGVKTEQEGGLAKSSNPQSTFYGDIHDYQYTRAFYNDAGYRVPRMASEYGLQSFPSYETLVPVYDPEDLLYESDLNNHRQHHIRGQSELMNQINLYMNPPNSTDSKQQFKDIIYCTQIDQAIGMRTETEHYRRWQSEINTRGEGNTMGALYWMLNDIWQAPTWSSLEYGGKWKMLHYFARHFFAPTLISPYNKGDQLYVYIVIDGIPSFEQRTEKNNHLKLCPLIDREPAGHLKSSKSKLHGGTDCISGIKCWNRVIWCLLIVAGIILILNQCYHTYKMTRYWKRLWKCSLIGLLVILLTASMQIRSSTDSEAPKHYQTTDKVVSKLAGKLYIQMFSWDSLETKHTWSIPFKLETVAQPVYTVLISDMLQEGGCKGPEYCFLIFHLGYPINGPTSWYSLTTFKDAKELKKPKLKVSDVSAVPKSSAYDIVITTDAPAPFVWLEAYGIKGRFSDNGFLMYTNSRTVKFYSWEQTDLKTLKKSLSIKSLMDIYV